MANFRPTLLLALALALGTWAANSAAHEPEALDRVEGEGDRGQGVWVLDENEAAPWADDADPRALTEFRKALDPHGEWYQHPQFGLLWVPYRASVGDAFVPYLSRGRWALDSHDNWVWQSDYPFGWVVFHYGRWVEVPGIGWGWIPGYTYSPAWVLWGSPADNIAYVGWAPLGPSFIWVDGVAFGLVGVWSPYWVFCRSHYAFSPYLSLHVVKDEGRRDYLRRRTVERNPSHRVPDPAYRGTPFHAGGTVSSSGAWAAPPRGITGDGAGRGEGEPPRHFRPPPSPRQPSARELQPRAEVRIIEPPVAAPPPRRAQQEQRKQPTSRRPSPGRLDAGQKVEGAPERVEPPSTSVERARTDAGRRRAPSPRQAEKRGKLRRTPATLRPERKGSTPPGARQSR